jgi:hypothetical protein
MLLVLLATVEYVVRLGVRRAARSTRGYDGFVLFGMVIAGAAVTFHHAPVWRFGVALGVGLVWFVTTRAELRFRGAGKAQATVNVGDPLPDFSARTSAGEPFAAKDLVARAPAMLVLYRGHW